MFKHLLVPLDGSNLAEAALPYASALAQNLGASVTLIHVIERNPPEKVHGATHLKDARAAQMYLDNVAQHAFGPSVHVICHVHTSEVSEVAHSIVEHAGEFQPDLIVMCTHGESDLKQRISGSIAQQVISQGKTSLLLIPPNETGASASYMLKTILVPLDGDPEHEQGIRVALGVAKANMGSLHMLVVINTPETLTGEKAATSRMLPGMTAELLNISEQTASNYLREQLALLKSSGLTLSAEVARGEPARTIVATAKRIKADLIVLGTHGKSGIDAFWQGSVAPKVSNRSDVPMLLVRLPS
jgi:nucleotide-binding universal stress UspA family protein